MRRLPLAILLVAALALLVAGGAVLGAFQAPTSTDLTVHNGAGETLLASRVTGSYTTSELGGVVISFDFRAPDHMSEKAVSSSGKVEGKRNVSGSQASQILEPVRRLLSLHKFSTHGDSYDRTLPASVLVPPATRPKVTGTYRTRVELAGGYVVAIIQRIDARDGSQKVKETLEYRLSRVGGWTRSS